MQAAHEIDPGPDLLRTPLQLPSVQALRLLRTPLLPSGQTSGVFILPSVVQLLPLVHIVIRLADAVVYVCPDLPVVP